MLNAITFDGVAETLGRVSAKVESDLRNQIEKGGETTGDLIRLQLLTQRWTLATELQSVMIHSVSGTLKFILERMI